MQTFFGKTSYLLISSYCLVNQRIIEKEIFQYVTVNRWLSPKSNKITGSWIYIWLYGYYKEQNIVIPQYFDSDHIY